jgi:hypothetical protein
LNLLSRLFGYATREEAAGARLDDAEPWIVPPTRDAAAVLRSLPILFPAGAVVYFEGTTEGSFAKWLKVHKTSSPLKVAYGTIWPRPDGYHVLLESALLEEAADLVKRAGIALPCIHLHVHDGKRVLLEWHDAFGDDPLYIASALPRDRVDLFVRAIGVGPVSRGTATAT